MTYKRPEKRTVTVANGGTTSAAFYVGDYAMMGIQTPSALTSTAITFLGSTSESGTFVAIEADGVAVSLAVSASKGATITGVELDALAPWPWLKLVCGSAEGAARSFIVALK